MSAFLCSYSKKINQRQRRAEEKGFQVIKPVKQPLSNLTGRKFGELEVIDFVGYNKHGGTEWQCVCNCGNTIIETEKNLRNNKRQHCNVNCKCKIDKIKSEFIGKTFYYLRVESLAKEKKNGCLSWNCRCTCGKTIVATGTALRAGLSRSCGCVISWGENLIKDILDANKISYKRQYSFKDLRGPKNGLLKFDFAVISNNELQYLIEFQGKQHYVESKRGSYYGVMQREITDASKKEYCAKHGIKLYEVKYDENIEDRMKEILSV